ncbi:hypothetical protein FBU30_006035 [Linnemannia zychae]|nr:hypothetical protein FBU30_006035 [Linnemannia zychae]
MSAEAPPSSEDIANGTSGGTPFKMSFGGMKAKSKGFARPTASVVKPTSAFGASSTEVPAEHHVDELIRGIDTPQEAPKELVIPKLENANWRMEALAKRKRAYLPEDSHTSDIAAVTAERDEPDETRVGLQIKRVKVETTTEQESSPMDIDANITTTTATTVIMTEEITKETKEETLEEAAARKVIEAATGGSGEAARRLILTGQENVHQDEVEAFQKNLEDLPDEASLEDYEKVPVEEFGAALLRGMGWKGDNNGSEAVEYSRRPALLGLGAKPREPEPNKKKYIKPGESRTPQSIPVPSRSSTTSRTSSSSGYRDSRENDDRGNKDRDGKEGRSSRDDRDHRDRRDRDTRDRRDDRTDREGREESNRDYRERNRDQDARDSRDSRKDDRGRDSDRDRQRDRDRDRNRDYRRDDRDRDRHRDYRRDDRDRGSRDDRRERRDRSRDRDRSPQ